MAFYLIQYEADWYANDELYTSAIAGGERAFLRLLARGSVQGRDIFDTTVYLLPDTAQQERCREFDPTVQDFDAEYRMLHRLSLYEVALLKEQKLAAYPEGRVIVISPAGMPDHLYLYKNCRFFRMQEYKSSQKYRILPHLASIPVCGRRYVALDMINTRSTRPVLLTA
jgi:hypothetical protein